MQGGKYLAEERGALEPGAPVQPASPERALEPFRAPLYELAAAHDGQPARDWLALFWRRYRAR